MVIRCRQREFILTPADVIVFDGHRYTLSTQCYPGEWGYQCFPVIAKNKMQKWIDGGLFVKTGERGNMTYYRLNLDG